MNTLKLLKIGSTILKEKKITSFNLDSEILLSNVLKKNRQDLIRNLDQKIHRKQKSIFFEITQFVISIFS